MNAISTDKLYQSHTNLILLDKDEIKYAKEQFVIYQKDGVIKPNYTFEGMEWQTTDEYSNIGLYFEFNKFNYKKYEKLIGLPLNSFIDYLKSFLLSLLGHKVLSGLYNTLLDIRHIIETPPNEVCNITNRLNISSPVRCADFFAMLPVKDNDATIELIEAFNVYADIKFSKNIKEKRMLADFNTYFLFDEIIKDYWNNLSNETEKLFYYPIYLWWLITAVVPLRPREFILTERNCLSKDKNNNYFLKLRRNEQKGARAHVSYTVNGAYSSDTYKIPEYLGKLIGEYQNLTSKYQSSDIDTLFITDPHYRKWGQKKRYNSRFFTYINMNTLLKCFYKEIICDTYGLRIMEEPNMRLKDDEIGYIHLGDTRHIALINLMQEGGTPVLAMLLAGHTNDTTASHYYSNITNLIECKTYRQYRRLISGNVKYQISHSFSLPQVGSYAPLSIGGKCFSNAYQNGDISDCIKVAGENGEIGYCPSCSYFRRSGISYFSGDDIYKRNIKDDCISLTNAIEVVRKEKGSIEDLGEILLRIKSGSNSYQAYLMQKYKEDSNGTT